MDEAVGLGLVSGWRGLRMVRHFAGASAFAKATVDKSAEKSAQRDVMGRCENRSSRLV